MSEQPETIFIRLATQDEMAEVNELIAYHMEEPKLSVEAKAPKRMGAELFEFKKTVIAMAGSTNEVVAAVRLQSLAGLPISEGMAEISDLVVDEGFRRKNIGKQILYSVIDLAKISGFKRLYLKTTPKMEVAQQLFKKFGFQPVTVQSNDELITYDQKQSFPCYFVLENLHIEKLANFSSEPNTHRDTIEE